MAKIQYGTWSRTADETGKLAWTAADGRTKLEVPLASIIGDVAWQDMDPVGQFTLAYGAKQWVSDGLAGKAGSMTEYITMLGDRIRALLSGEAVTGGFPYAAEAISKVKGIAIERAKEVWNAASAEKKAQWYQLSNVQAAVKLVKQERERARNETLIAVSAGLEDFEGGIED